LAVVWFAVIWTCVPTPPDEGSTLDIPIAPKALDENESIIKLSDNISARDISCSILSDRFFIILPLSFNEWFEQLYR
jgi:hypothetical protein